MCPHGTGALEVDGVRSDLGTRRGAAASRSRPGIRAGVAAAGVRSLGPESGTVHVRGSAPCALQVATCTSHSRGAEGIHSAEYEAPICGPLAPTSSFDGGARRSEAGRCGRVVEWREEPGCRNSCFSEFVWVLESVYRLGSQEVGAAVDILLNHAQLALEDSEVVSAALAQYRARRGVGFSDCLVLEVARRAGHLPLGTFDRALAKLPGVSCVDSRSGRKSA